MELVREYILNHQEITGGRFSWYDRSIFNGIVNGRPAHISVRVYSDDISIDTDDRAALIEWTYQYNGFDRFFTDPEKVKREYTSEDGRRLIVSYYRDQDASGYVIDDEIDLFPDPDNPESEFANYDEFKAAVIQELEADGSTYEFEPEA